jgi:hypothetical protein
MKEAISPLSSEMYFSFAHPSGGISDFESGSDIEDFFWCFPSFYSHTWSFYVTGIVGCTCIRGRRADRKWVEKHYCLAEAPKKF